MDKVLIVSGGSQGIGLASAKRFLREGYRVINLSRRPTPLVAAEHLQADMEDPDWLEQCAGALLERIGEPSSLVLLHNAARQDFSGVDELDAQTFRAALQVNLVAPQQLNQLLIPRMGRGSAILYIGSTLAEKAVAGTAAYIASKHGLVGLMRATVQDLAGRGIHSACICPGFTDTTMLRSHIGHGTELEANIAGMVTQGRLIEVNEIADSVWFCATSPVINGAVIHANLGQIER